MTMERTITTIQEHARELNLTGLAVTVDVLLEDARKNEPSYSDFALTLLNTERSLISDGLFSRSATTIIPENYYKFLCSPSKENDWIPVSFPH